MKKHYLTASLLLLLSTLLFACDRNDPKTSVAQSEKTDVIELDWDALIPADLRQVWVAKYYLCSDRCMKMLVTM